MIGFTAQRSTVDVTISATNFIKKVHEKKGYTLLIALDIIGAFDQVW
jgi:hypothetical protein